MFSLTQAALTGISQVADEAERTRLRWPGGDPADSDSVHRFERTCWAAGLFFQLVSGLAAVGASVRLLAGMPFVAEAVGVILILAVQFLILEGAARFAGLGRPVAILRFLAMPSYVIGWPFLGIGRLVWSVSPHFVVEGPGGDQREVSIHELRVLPTLQGMDRVVDEEAVEMIDSVREFGEGRARDIMTPRTEIEGVPIGIPREELFRRLRETRYSRLIVYRNTLDDIAGVLLVKQVLLEKPEQPITLLREPLVVPSELGLSGLLDTMRHARLHLAVVVDEYGGTEGIVTLHDLFEAILGGHIEDADEEEEFWIERLDADHARLSGLVELWEINEEFGLDLDEDSARTIAGYLMNSVGRLPEEGEEIAAAGGKFRVLKLNNNRVDLVTFERVALVAPDSAGLEEKAS